MNDIEHILKYFGWGNYTGKYSENATNEMRIKVLLENSQWWDDKYIEEEYGCTREELDTVIKKYIIKKKLKE